MISMLSQLSSSQDKAAPFQYEKPRAPKGWAFTELVVLGGSALFALFVVNGIHGLAQAFGIA